MTKFANCVRFKVKPRHVQEFIKSFNDREKFDGMEFIRMVQTGANTFVSFGEWESEEALAAARPEMISFLDTFRDKLEEISPDLGVTDPVSGPVVVSR